jgi:hypothetical protein
LVHQQFSPIMATSSPHQRDVTSEWLATRAVEAEPTRLLDDEPEVRTAATDIGVRVSATLRELFVSCDAGLALQQQFEHLTPDFIALHDLGTRTSRSLLARLAAASSQAVQQLSIRRQGFGHELASLEFVDLPTPGGRALRLYSTEVDADTTTRHAMAHTLLGHARLGVLMVGALPAHALHTALRPLQDAMRAGPWPSRQLLLMPLAAPGNLAQVGSDMAREAHIEVQTTPRVNRPSDAWNFISSSWNRLRDAPPPSVPSGPRPATAGAAAPATHADGAFEFTPASAPVPFDRRTSPAAAAHSSPVIEAPLQSYIDKVVAIKGMVSACVFDHSTGLPLVHAGARPEANTLASHGQQLLSAMWASSRAMGLGQTLPEAAITLGQHHLLLRPLPGRPGLAVHAVLDQTQANLTLARVQLQNLDGTLSDA